MLSMITDHLTFFIIGLAVIFIVIVAYVTFVVPKSYTPKDKKQKKLIDMDEMDDITKQMGRENVTSKQDKKQASSPTVKAPLDTSMTSEDILEETKDDSFKHDGLNEEKASNVEKPEKIAPLLERHNSDNENLEDQRSVDNQTDEIEEDPSDDENENEEEKPIELGKYHVLYRDKDNKWYVKREGSEKTIRVLHTKKEAVAYATIKAINQDTNIVIHNKDGKIEKHGY